MSTLTILSYLGITTVSEVDENQPNSIDVTTIELNEAAKEMTMVVVIKGNILIGPNPLPQIDFDIITISKTTITTNIVVNNDDIVQVDVSHLYYGNDKYAIVNKININNVSLIISSDGKAMATIETNVIEGSDALTRPIGQLVGTVNKFDYFIV